MRYVQQHLQIKVFYVSCSTRSSSIDYLLDFFPWYCTQVAAYFVFCTTTNNVRCCSVVAVRKYFRRYISRARYLTSQLDIQLDNISTFVPSYGTNEVRKYFREVRKYGTKYGSTSEKYGSTERSTEVQSTSVGISVGISGCTVYFRNYFRTFIRNTPP